MRRSVLVAAVGVIMSAGIALAGGPTRELTGVRSWGYWLTNIKPAVVAASGSDLVVIDYSSDGGDDNAFSPMDLAMMQKKSDRSRRLVLAYLSIGEAEDYRYYWKRDWKRNPPTWLDRENPEWKGNYRVRYWDRDWQQIIFGAPDAYLDRIIAAGFDGVYLDVVDAFESYEETRPEAQAEMIRFVTLLSKYAKGKRPGFLVFPQNGERLLERAEYRDVIDGIAKEDLFYGHGRDNAPVQPEETQFSAEYLDMALRDGKPVLTVDYPTERLKAEDAYRKSRERGYVPYVTVRGLDRFVENAGSGQALIFETATAGDGKATAGRYAATTPPKGTFRNTFAVNYYTEAYRYSYGDFQDDPPPAGMRTDFEAERFTEITATYTVAYGLTDQWEVGAAIPVVKGVFEKDPDDQVTGLKETYDQTGLGNMKLLLSHAVARNEGDASIRTDLELGLPTDSRDEPLASSEFMGRLAVTGEHYWGGLGVIGLLAVNATADRDSGSEEAFLEFQIGGSWQVSKRLCTVILIGREDEANTAEFDLEYTLSKNQVLMVNIGADPGGNREAFFVEAGLYF